MTKFAFQDKSHEAKEETKRCGKNGNGIGARREESAIFARVLDSYTAVHVTIRCSSSFYSLYEAA